MQQNRLYQPNRHYRFPEVARFKDIEEDFPLVQEFLDFVCANHTTLKLDPDHRRRLVLRFFKIDPDKLAREEEELQRIVDAL
ncbi:MAG: hypothetical protein DYG98_07970 [Haliscomenobacteraceae bacterium CHB4]|nr:hypothetical protein [Haliscomenobacteraceae bacterium CHB4]